MAFIITCGRVDEEEASSQEDTARELRLRKQLLFIVMSHCAFIDGTSVCSTFTWVPLGVSEEPSAPYRPLRSVMASSGAVSGAL